MDIESFLSEIGYEIGTEGSKYFSTLLESVIYQMSEGLSNKEIRESLQELIKTYSYKFFRVPRMQFFKEIASFLNSKPNKKNKGYKKVENTLISLGRYYLKKEEAENCKIKTFTKQK